MKSYLNGAAMAVLAFAIAAPAMAAEAASTTAAAATPAAAIAGLADIVVTATKRETNVQKTSIAISVLTSQAMQDNHAESLIALSDGSVPSLRIATFEARQSALTVGIRGIVPFDANQTARDQGVGVYIDGVYLGRQQGLNATLYDVERIEVLRGPQGTLFGRNTEGGAVSIVTKAPTGKGGGQIVAGLGNFGSYEADLHHNFQEFNNLAIKFDGVLQHQDPTTKNPLAGQAGWNQYDRKGARITGLYRPTEQFSAQLSGDFMRDENTPFFSQLVSFNPYGKTVRSIAAATGNAPAGTINPLAPLVHVHTSRQSTSDIGTVQQPSVDQAGGVTLTMKYALTPHLELRSITAGRGVSTAQWDNSGVESRNVFAANATFGRYSLSTLNQNQFSQEFQAVGDLGASFSYVGGLYYFKEHVKEEAETPLTNQWNADGTGYTIRSAYGTPPYNTSTLGGWQPGTQFVARASHGDATSYAVFAQGTYTPAAFDKLHLTVGGRYTNDKRSGVLYAVNGKAANFPFSLSAGRIDPLANLAYDLTDTVNLYAKYSTGYRAGGANARSSTFAAFAAEEVKAYEIGAKMDLMDRRLRVNLAAYAMDRSNSQIDFDSVDLVVGSPTQGSHTENTTNASGVSHIKGVEVDITGKVTDEVTVGLSYAYTDIKIPSAPYPFTGNPLFPPGTPFPVQAIYTPPNAASAYIDYVTPVGSMTFHGHLDAAYADAQYSFQSEYADVSPTGVQNAVVAQKGQSSFIVNGNVALGDIAMGGSTATLSLWSRNLLDESYIYRISAANRGTIGDYANFNPPRTFGVELRVKY